MPDTSLPVVNSEVGTQPSSDPVSLTGDHDSCLATATALPPVMPGGDDEARVFQPIQKDSVQLDNVKSLRAEDRRP